MDGIRPPLALSENFFSIGKENESVYHNSGSWVIGLNVFSNKYKVGLEVRSGEKWSRERHEHGEFWQPLAHSRSFLRCWVAFVTLGIFEDCWYKAQWDTLCFQNSLLESGTLLDLKVILSLNWTGRGFGPKWVFSDIKQCNLQMLMKPHRSGNLCNGVLCSSGLWTGFQRRNSRGIISTFLSAPHPSSQCRADPRCKMKTKWLEPFGSSLALSSVVGLSPSHGPGGFGWARAKTIFSKAGCVWSTEIHHWGGPWDGVMARDADSPLGTAWFCSFGPLLDPQ